LAATDLADPLGSRSSMPGHRRVPSAGSGASSSFDVTPNASRADIASASRPPSGGQGAPGQLVDTSRAGVKAAVLCAALPALCEALREQSLGRCAFQQIQLDVHFLRPHVLAAVEGAAEEGVALQLLEEVMAAAMERCTEPLLLETSVLDKILSNNAGTKGR
ncbi:hypothetical protein H632_c20p0, partial [Helicosporidium sp. ATCC 50920]